MTLLVATQPMTRVSYLCRHPCASLPAELDAVAVHNPGQLQGQRQAVGGPTWELSSASVNQAGYGFCNLDLLLRDDSSD